MGFSSFLCSKSGTSIPSHHSKKTIKESKVVIIMPDNSTFRFTWDGYGLSTYKGARVDDAGRKLPRNFESIWSLYEPFKKDYLDYDPTKFEWPKRVTYKGKTTIIDQFNWGTPLDQFDGLSLNEINKGENKVEHADDVMNGLIKVVKEYNYKEERFQDLLASEYCPYQGFFYPNNFSFKKDLRR